MPNDLILAATATVLCLLKFIWENGNCAELPAICKFDNSLCTFSYQAQHYCLQEVMVHQWGCLHRHSYLYSCSSWWWRPLKLEVLLFIWPVDTLSLSAAQDEMCRCICVCMYKLKIYTHTDMFLSRLRKLHWPTDPKSTVILLSILPPVSMGPVAHRPSLFTAWRGTRKVTRISHH